MWDAQLGKDVRELLRILDRDVVRRRGEIIRAALAAVTLRRDDEFAPRRLPIQAPAGTEHHELRRTDDPARLIALRRGNRRADAREVKRDVRSLVIHAVNGNVPVARADEADLFAGKGFQQMLIDLLRKQDQARFDKVLLLAIKVPQADDGFSLIVKAVGDHMLQRWSVSFSSASFAAICSASFLLRPAPLPTAPPLSSTSK